MSAAPESEISVLVVAGPLRALQRLGFPLPAIASMQEAGALLTDAHWTIRKTATGLSVSLFWPSVSTSGSVVAKSCNVEPSKSKKRRLRRQRSKNLKKSVASRPAVVMESGPSPVLASGAQRHHSSNICRASPMSERSGESSTSQRPRTRVVQSVSLSECSGVSLASHRPPADVRCVSPLSQRSGESSFSQIEESLDITLCHRSPDLIIRESDLSPSVVDPPVFYHEANLTPGVCVDRGDGGFSWSPVKVSKSAVKVGSVHSSDDTSVSDVDTDDCLGFEYQLSDGVPGFEVETRDDLFWAPIAHRTRLRQQYSRKSLVKTGT